MRIVIAIIKNRAPLAKSEKRINGAIGSWQKPALQVAALYGIGGVNPATKIAQFAYLQ